MFLRNDPTKESKKELSGGATFGKSQRAFFNDCKQSKPKSQALPRAKDLTPNWRFPEKADSSQCQRNNVFELNKLTKFESSETFEQSNSTKQESLLLTFSGNAFPSQEFRIKINESKISEEMKVSILPSPPVSLQSKSQSQNEPFESPRQPKTFFFPSSSGLRAPVKVRREGIKTHARKESVELSENSSQNQFHSTFNEKYSNAQKQLNFEQNFDFNEFLLDSQNQNEASPDILQRLMKENEQLREKTRSNEEMVKRLLGIIEERYKDDMEVKKKVAEVTKFQISKPKLQINISALTSMKNGSEASIIMKPRIFSNRGARVVGSLAERVPKSAEGRNYEEGGKEIQSLHPLPSLKKEGTLPRIKSSALEKGVFSPSNSKGFPRKNYKFQTLNPRIPDNGEEELRSTKGKFPKELFSMVSKKKFVI